MGRPPLTDVNPASETATEHSTIFSFALPGNAVNNDDACFGFSYHSEGWVT